MTRIAATICLAVFVLAATACEPFGDKDKENLQKACGPAPAAAAKPTLPAGFPDAAGITYTGVRRDGPATVASGYLDKTIGPAHEAYARAIKGAPGFSVTKEEQDEADAEVNFSGNGKSGQVKLVQACESRTNVTVTIRPA